MARLAVSCRQACRLLSIFAGQRFSSSLPQGLSSVLARIQGSFPAYNGYLIMPDRSVQTGRRGNGIVRYVVRISSLVILRRPVCFCLLHPAYRYEEGGTLPLHNLCIRTKVRLTNFRISPPVRCSARPGILSQVNSLSLVSGRSLSGNNAARPSCRRFLFTKSWI